MKCKYKKRIKNQVCHRADRDRNHAGHRIPLRIDKRIHSGRKHRRDRSDQINHHVRIRINKRRFRRTKQNEQRSGKHQSDRHKHDSARTDHCKRSIDDCLGPSGFIHSSVNREDRRATASEQVTECRNHNDQRKAQSHRAECCRTYIRNAGNIDAVHNVVEQTKDLRHQHRNRCV